MALHRATYAEIDLSALRKNFNAIRAALQPQVKIMAVVKADAYGHGAVPCAKAFLEAGADCLGAGIIAEGIELRESGINAPVQILAGIFSDEIEDLIKYDLSTTLYSLEMAEAIAKKAAREGKQAGLHLKIDTGMSRLGAAPEAFPELAEFVGKSKNLRIESVFTHLSSADEDPEYTLLQLSRFDDILSKVKSMGIDINLAHCANSAALLTFPQSQYDMVRPGIITYGALPSPNLKPQAKELFSGDNDAEGPLPVMQWKTGILQISSLPENTPLSYGKKFVTARESLIATLPVGYADGLSRGLSNKMKVLVRGQRAPQVGTICMDMCMIDVTDIPDAQIGDEVVIFGKQGDESITADELAEWQETVSHEILTAVAQRVPRKYLP